MLKLYVSFLILGAVVASEVAYQNDNESIDIFPELPCLTIGGYCLVAGDCPEGKLSKVSGLCPLQQTSGVECCRELPLSAPRCRVRGGECWSIDDPCPEELTYDGPSECNADEKCCILVH